MIMRKYLTPLFALGLAFATSAAVFRNSAGLARLRCSHIGLHANTRSFVMVDHSIDRTAQSLLKVCGFDLVVVCRQE